VEVKRTLLALILTIGVVVLWNTFFLEPPPPPLPVPAEDGAGAQRVEPGPSGSEKPLPSPLSSPIAPATAKPGEVSADESDEAVAAGDAIDRIEVTADEIERTVRISSSLYTVVISNRGGVVRGWSLNQWPAVATWPEGEPSGPVRVFTDSDEALSLAPLGLFTGDSDVDASLAGALYEMEGGDVRLGSGESATVVLRWSDGRSRVEKRLTFNGSHHGVALEVSASLERSTPLYLAIGPGLAAAGGLETLPPGQFQGQAAVLAGGELERLMPQKFKLKKIFEASGGRWPPASSEWMRLLDASGQTTRIPSARWAGLEETHFAAIVRAESTWSEVVVLPLPRQADRARPRLVVGIPVRERPESMILYVGPKQSEMLGAVDAEFVDIIEYGKFFGFMAKIMLTSLQFLHGYLGNWGFAIIVLTIGIKILFLPLTAKQLSTAQKMAKLGPQMKALEAKYAAKRRDPKKRMEANQAMQKERMELFQREGVNPLAGCLPLLAYLPFLYGFYALLRVSIELRHASFLWVLDLSAREDPFPVLVILMVISMLIQQAITPSSMDPMQRRMMFMMPLVFGLMFRSMASGLVLFWLTQNVLSIGQQVFMNYMTARRQERENDAKLVKSKG